MLKNFWNDDCGAIVTVEIILIITILGIGLIVGLTTVRDAVNSELADVAAAVNNIDQSYSYSGVIGHSSTTSGGLNIDQPDFCDTGNSTSQSGNSSCVEVPGGPLGADTGK
jgi:Flp pilus assembly pilin Flp